MLVKDLMTRNVIVAHVPGSVRELVDIFKKYGVSGVPVVKKGTRELVGIVTRRDLVKNPSEDQIAMIMTRNPYAVSPEATIEECARIMMEKNVRRLPVVRGSELVGIISVFDLVSKALTRMNIQDPVERYMQKACPAVWEKTPLPLAFEIMRLVEKDFLLCLDESGNLTGIVTDDDMVRALREEITTEVSDISGTIDGDIWEWEKIDLTTLKYITSEKISLPNVPCENVMTKNLITVTKKTSVSKAAKIIAENKIKQLPVVDPATGKPLGVVTDRDLIRSLIRGEH